MLSSDRTFKSFVIPFGIYLLLGGALIVVLAAVLPSFPVPATATFPFVRGEQANRLVAEILGLVCATIGVGLLRRHRAGWYALLAYCVFGVAVPVAGFFDEPLAHELGHASFIFGAWLNAALGFGIYFALRPAFDIRGTSPSRLRSTTTGQ